MKSDRFKQYLCLHFAQGASLASCMTLEAHFIFAKIKQAHLQKFCVMHWHLPQEALLILSFLSLVYAKRDFETKQKQLQLFISVSSPNTEVAGADGGFNS